MIHVMTVHWLDSRWIDIQLSYLKKNIDRPYLTYAFLNGISTEHYDKFHYVSDENIKQHAVKLNLLADMACFNAESDDDWLFFIDGDAFPIASVDQYAQPKLEKNPLIAVQRKENFADIQPHPSFCITTVGFWKQIRGDWKSGYTWNNARGESVTDVGGNLLGILNEKGFDWYPVLRSNIIDLHPLSFGLYGDVLYHHGAGFREHISRVDLEGKGIRMNSLYFKVLSSLPKKLNRLWNPARIIARKNERLSEKIFQWILKDETFFAALNSSTKSWPEDIRALLSTDK
ncbi:MAG: hypothetical protein AAFP77_18090 [Bacteroidota bacterium]